MFQTSGTWIGDVKYKMNVDRKVATNP